jgi:hypothetical protein
MSKYPSWSAKKCLGQGVERGSKAYLGMKIERPYRKFSKTPE